MSFGLRGLGPLTRVYLLQSFRSKTALFWNLVFPLVWLFLFGFLFFRGNAALAMPGLFTITIVSASFFGVSYTMVSEREAGILRRYRVTPVKPLTVVLANGIRALVMMTLSVGVQALVGWLVFRYPVEGSLMLLTAFMIFGAAAFVPLGLIVGSVAQDMRTAPAISNALFFPLVFGSGAAYPLSMMPDWLQGIARLIPSSYLVEILQGVMLRGLGLLDLLGPLMVLGATMGAGAWVNAYIFRWESDEPVDRRRLLLGIAGLLAVMAIAALLAPSFRMTSLPTTG